ncbi:hypothetical protein [Lysinibacillus fusiformis]|uniref:hypothetical protein n=1 Tax=Lysinibacillus fusiformis TaxID=28031 RepID=UPI001EF52C38|nr:hypothetical protein [Lysinibacillus fusiformis]MCG7435564.1 hypothetical protein [Lysinibacillus fusiformis]
MLNTALIDDLVCFFNETLKEMRLPTKDEDVERAPTAYDGYLPPKKNQSKRRDDSDTEQEDFPYVIVRYLGEEDTQYKENVVALRVLIGTYSKDEQHGWRDTLNVMNRIKIALGKKQTIGAASLTGTISMALFEDHPRPMWHGVMEVQFNLPQVVWEGSILDGY